MNSRKRVRCGLRLGDQALSRKRRWLLLDPRLAALSAACLLMLVHAIHGQHNAPDEPRPFASPRELLESMGVDASHFDLLRDGEPLDLNEQEPLLRILYALRKCPVLEVERFARSEFDASEALEAGAVLRGEIYRLRGRVTHVTREKPLAEVLQRFEMPDYYRCTVVIDDATLATVITLAIPKAWPLDTEFSQRVSCLGLYLKQGKTGEAQTGAPIFAAQRLAWHPQGLLGDLGMDVGQFDHVQNKAPIGPEERECFYQLLAAAGKADPEKLFQLTQRPPEEDYSVVPLFNAPGEQHGKLIALTGTARRAILVKLDPTRDAEIIRRFGLNHYYQVDIFTNDSQGNPIVFCVRQLPPGMPQGPAIYERMRIPGFFFKSWAYRVQPLDEQPASGHQLAPMLIGNQAYWLPAESGRHPLAGIVGAGLFLAALAGLFLAVWAYNRGDRKFRQRVLDRQSRPASGPSLDDIHPNGPDSANLT